MHKEVNIIQKWALVATSLLMFVIFVATTAASHASTTQESLFRGDGQIGNTDPATQAAVLNELQALGVDTLVLGIGWKKLAPIPDKKTTKPGGFDGSQPSSYPSAAWDSYDLAVRGAKARGMKIVLLPSTPAPFWSRAIKKGGKLTFQKNPKVNEYAAFVQAVARRYSGAYADEDGSGVLPKVDWFSFVNEPNYYSQVNPASAKSPLLGRYGRYIPASPHYYRLMFIASAKAIRKIPQHKGTPIFAGETAPYGSKRLAKNNTLPPALFMREFFCLDAKNRPYKGIERRARGCPPKFPKIDAQAISHHPYTQIGGGTPPTTTSKNPNDVFLVNINTLKKIAQAAVKYKRLPKTSTKLYVTEFGFQTNPPDLNVKVTPDQQAVYINRSEYIFYRNKDVHSYSQYLLQDAPLNTWIPVGNPKRYGNFQSGLRFMDNTPKPSYDAYRLPIWVIKKGAGAVTVWGTVRPKVRPTTVYIESSDGSGFTDTGTSVNITSKQGYFTVTVSISGASTRSYRLRWVDGNGTTFYSRKAKPSSK